MMCNRKSTPEARADVKSEKADRVRPMGVRSQEVAVLSTDIKVIDETTRLKLLHDSGERRV